MVTKVAGSALVFDCRVLEPSQVGPLLRRLGGGNIDTAAIALLAEEGTNPPDDLHIEMLWPINMGGMALLHKKGC